MELGERARPSQRPPHHAWWMAPLSRPAAYGALAASGRTAVHTLGRAIATQLGGRLGKWRSEYRSWQAWHTHLVFKGHQYWGIVMPLLNKCLLKVPSRNRWWNSEEQVLTGRLKLQGCRFSLWVSVGMLLEFRVRGTKDDHHRHNCKIQVRIIGRF